MTFSPIVARELLGASRSRRTFMIRVAIAVATVFLAFAVFVYISATGYGRAPAYFLFRVLAWTSFVFALVSGLWLTADAIGGERRDGTLGLLFLSELGGAEIVFAKLVTHGLTALGGVVAAFPVMTVAWLFGGLTGSDMVHTFLAVLNTLFVSLAVGLAMSAYPQRAGESILLTGIWLGISVGVLPILHVLLAQWGVPTGQIVWLDVNLLTSFRTAAGLLMPLGLSDPGRFWSALGLTHAVGWGALIFASWAVRRWAYQPPVSGDSERPVEFARRRALLPTGFRADLLAVNPILALVGIPRSIYLGMWLLVVTLGLAGFAAWAAGLPPVSEPMLLFSSGRFSNQPALLVALVLFALGVRALFAWQATEFFAEGRRSQLLQTICTTPLRDEEILRGPWLALTRTFRLPLLVAAGLSVVQVALYCWRPTGLYSPGAAPLGVGEASRAFVLGYWAYGWFSLVADLAAMVWSGAYFSFWLERRQVAFGVTFFLSGVLPSLIVCLPSGLISMAVFFVARSQFRFGVRRLFVGERQMGERSWAPLIEE